jgi:hypothetical protein
VLTLFLCTTTTTTTRRHGTADWLSEKLKEVGSHTHHGMRAPPPAGHHEAAAAAGGFGAPAGGYI